jgi:hypothetical protein
LRLQARAYMLAHGANPDAMSEDDYQLVMVALGDGLIGNKAVANINGMLTTGVFNYLRASNSQAYKLEDILGVMHKYIYKPLSDEEAQNLASQRLLAFMSMNPNSPEVLHKK